MDGFGLGDLAEEESDDYDDEPRNKKEPDEEQGLMNGPNTHSRHASATTAPGTANFGSNNTARLSGSGRARVERETVKPNKGGGS